MVKKLLKHDLYALFRVLGFVFIGVTLFAVAGSTIIFLLGMVGQHYQNVWAMLLVNLLYTLSIYAVTGVIIAPYIVVWVHYYRSLFSRQGYLTHSLPATPTQVLWSKLLSSFIVIAAAYLVSGFSAILLFASYFGPLGFTELGQLYAEILQLLATPKAIVYLIEIAIFLLVAQPTSMLVVDTIITLGQLFNSHRMLFTFLLLIGVYFLYYVCAMAVVTVLIVVMAIVASMAPEIAATIFEAFWHVFIVLGTLVTAGINVGAFFLIRYLLTRKVNLLA